MLASEDLPLLARVAALLVLRYAQPISRIVRLTPGDVIRDEASGVSIRLGEPPSPQPNFNSVLLYDTCWYNSANNASRTPGDAGAFPIDMCHLCDTLLDSTGSLGSDGQPFPVTWDNAGP